MYNEGRKIDFIKHKYKFDSSSAKLAMATFEICAPFEEEWGADICTRSAEEIEPVANKLIGLRSQSRWPRFNILKSYVQWCQAIGVPDVCDGVFNVKFDELSKLRTQMVRNPAHLQKYLDEICEPESENTVDITYRCYYWMAYGGIDEDDIPKITVSDIDFGEKIIKYRNTAVEIYRQAWPAFDKAIHLTEFRWRGRTDKDGNSLIRERSEGYAIVRGISGEPDKNVMRATLSRRAKQRAELGLTEMRLSYSRVWMSGLFYRMYQEELATGIVDFSDVARQFMDGKTYSFEDDRMAIDAKRRKIQKNYMNDYQRWKAAFY